MEKTFTENTNKGQMRKVVCSRCNSYTNHKVCHSTELFWDSVENDIQGKHEYEVIQCLGCDEISFRICTSNSEDYSYDDKGGYIPHEVEEIYPNRLKGRKELREQYFLPEKIRFIYKETHTALMSRLNILAGVGIRALIEAVCLEEKTEGRNLEKKINDLVVKTVLTKNNAEILHKTRFLGNRSAHKVEAASNEELAIAFDIIENLLETLYIIPKKAERLKK